MKNGDILFLMQIYKISLILFSFLSKLKALKISINFIIFAIFLKLLVLCRNFLKFKNLHIKLIDK